MKQTSEVWGNKYGHRYGLGQENFKRVRKKRNRDDGVVSWCPFDGVNHSILYGHDHGALEGRVLSLKLLFLSLISFVSNQDSKHKLYISLTFV